MKKSFRSRESPSFLEEISGSLPSLLEAYQLTKRASRVGFDWPDLSGVLGKLDEETEELKEALFSKEQKRIGEEIGDLLFVVANIARFLEINPEAALKETLKKFRRRFRFIEVSLQRRGKSLSESNLMEMEALWQKAKRKGKRSSKSRTP